MPLLTGVVTAGIAEATRVAQTVIHRGAEAGIAVVTGEKSDRDHADRIPETGTGARIARRPSRERRQGRDDGRGRRDDEPEPDTGATTGSLIDLQA